MKSKLFLFVSLLFVICLNCKTETELHGTVFIVTKGGQNYKLGLVKVTAIPENAIQGFIENKKSAVVSKYNDFKAQNESSKNILDRAQKEYDEAKTNFNIATQEMDELKNKEQELNEKYNPYDLELDEKLYEIYSPEMKTEVFRRRQLQAQIQKQLQTLKLKIAKYQPKLDSSQQSMHAAEKKLFEIKSQLNSNKQKLLELLSDASLYEGLPGGEIKTVSDAEGKFILKLPNAGRFVIAAHSERRVIDITEQYYWMIWVNLDEQNSKQIMLTNQNMLGQDSEDSVFRIKDMFPDLSNEAIKFSAHNVNRMLLSQQTESSF